ncbi:hypothetical protein M231_01500 [Tremella mesenterica]|uniref:Vacuolar protein sorting-associated protein 52 n=1 Tax=Tremella mesenterica TaxID=5217 RepID=A0A4V1M4P6_TREME|nr:hypothetical protein M231_01500 [Tremella mesenterica]
MDSPGAGPSGTQHEDDDREYFLRHRRDYVELDQAVQSSTELLSSLAAYLSNFQTDLSAVSGQISELQQKSADIEGQLEGRKIIIPSLNCLLIDVILPPWLVLTLRDTTPSQNPEQWLLAIPRLEEKINAIATRTRVKATQEIEGVLNGLKTKALKQLPTFLLTLIKPLRSSSKGLSTNLAVLQTSLLLKYQTFYAFLHRQSPRLAKQVERGYVNAARAYYETGMRRYCRALGQIKARSLEGIDVLGVVTSDPVITEGETSSSGVKETYERLVYAHSNIEGEDGSIVLAYMADDKDFLMSTEALFRSLSLVLVDNASAEFTFLVRFFGRLHIREKTAPLSPSRPESPSESGRSTWGRDDEGLKEPERIWHEVFDPALEYCHSLFQSMITPPPPAVPLLIMIRLNDELLTTCETRGTLPILPFLQGQKLAMWPLYRQQMDSHITSVHRLADEAAGKGLAAFMGRSVKDGTVRQIALHYAALFSCVVTLSETAEEVMLFSSMTRIRTEVTRLIETQASKIKASSDRHSFLSSIYEIIMRELVSGPGQATHPKLQAELSFFRTREEEARRKITE